MAIRNHWKHWKDHIIIFGFQIVTEKYVRVEDGWRNRAGVEVCFFGFGFQSYGRLAKWWITVVLKINVQFLDIPAPILAPRNIIGKDDEKAWSEDTQTALKVLREKINKSLSRAC